MSEKKTTDQKTLDLISEIKRRKNEISKLEKPNWRTNCSFTYNEGRLNEAINIHVESNVKNLVSIAAFLIDRERNYESAANILEVEAPSFTWCGFAVSDWIEDLKTRISKINIQSKRKKLEVLESRLNLIISPELRAELELQAITEELD